MSRIITSTLVALIAAAALAPSAFAQTASAPKSLTVAYGDLDMSTVSGGKILLTRIQSAARKVCGDSDAYSPLQPASETVCRRATVASVVEGLGIGTLTQAFNGGKSAASQVASSD